MRIAVCDDNLNCSALISEHIESMNINDISTVDIYDDADKLLFASEDIHYDLIFMDIELGDASGIDLSKKILKINSDTQIVFISGYDKYYLDVYDVPHIYFLKKPIEYDRLNQAISFALEKYNINKRNYINIFNKNSISKIPINNILFLEKKRRLVLIYTTNGTVYDTYGKFSDIITDISLPLYKCHNSYIVNFDYVSNFGDRKFTVKFTNLKYEVPISKSYFHNAKSAFSEFLIKG